jgi:hypothetical protein
MKNISRVVLLCALVLYVVAVVRLVQGGQPVSLVVSAFAVTMLGLVLGLRARRQEQGAG